MPATITITDEILEPYRAGDWHECARRLRLSVEADPFATLPRHILANLYVRLGQQASALLHYEKLLPVAVGKGELLRAIVVQRRIDELNSRPNAAARFAAMYRWFRMLGEQNLAQAAGLRNQGVSALTLIRLPAEGFVATALRCTVETFELEPKSGTFEGGVQWIVLWGSSRWRITSEGDPVGQGHADEGASIQTRLGLGIMKMLVSPMTPGEWIRIDRELMEYLIEMDPSLIRDEGLESDFVRDESSRFWARPQPRSDLDSNLRRRRPGAAAPPPPPMDGPPKLTLGDQAVHPAASRDTGDWMEFGQVDLDGSGARIEPVQEPVAETSASEEATPDDASSPERRQVRRVPVTFAARVALMGLSDAREAALVGDVVDLSMGGVGLCFPARDLEHALNVLKDETLRIDLITSDGNFLELAGRVRWLDFSDRELVQGGVQFVLLTDSDREAIARLVIDADPGV